MNHSKFELVIKRIIYNNPAIPNAIAPTISLFQEINKITNKTIDGILCINKAKAVSQNPRPFPKTSRENKVKNKINTILKIRGVQNKNLLTFLLVLFFL
jgi:hypothetical protein